MIININTETLTAEFTTPESKPEKIEKIKPEISKRDFFSVLIMAALVTSERFTYADQAANNAIKAANVLIKELEKLEALEKAEKEKSEPGHN